MEYFAAPGACSFGGHVVIRELDLPIPVSLVGLGPNGAAIRRVNTLGRVPALRLDDGTLLTENAAILPYLADLAPESGLFAYAGTVERAQIQSWIGYVNSEIHAASLRAVNRPERYSHDPRAHEGIRATGLVRLSEALAHVEQHLANRNFLVGDRFTIADAYFGLFAELAVRFGDAVGTLPAITRYHYAYEARDSVLAARAYEHQAVAA